MSEYRKQAAFLKAMLTYEESSSVRSLLERLSHAERNERCLLCSCRLVGLIALLGLAGLGYSAVLLPEFFDQSTHAVIHLCTAVSLGSGFCLMVFLGLWFWYRSLVNRIHDECRRRIITTLDFRLKGTKATLSPLPVQDPGLSIQGTRVPLQNPMGPPRPEASAELIPFPKAS